MRVYNTNLLSMKLYDRKPNGKLSDNNKNQRRAKKIVKAMAFIKKLFLTGN